MTLINLVWYNFLIKLNLHPKRHVGLTFLHLLPVLQIKCFCFFNSFICAAKQHFHITYLGENCSPPAVHAQMCHRAPVPREPCSTLCMHLVPWVSAHAWDFSHMRKDCIQESLKTSPKTKKNLCP